MPALTNASVAAAKPKAKRYELVDGEGLALVVMPSGAKIWRLRYRVKATRERKRIVIGKYPDLSLSNARGEAAGYRGDVQRGADPAAERDAERSALRMVDLLGQTDPEDRRKDKPPGWYLETYVLTAGKNNTAKSPKGIAGDRSSIAKHLRRRKAFMRKRPDAVTVGDLNRIKAATTPAVWRKLRNILLVCFRHAEDVGALVPGTNPVAKTTAQADKQRERFLSPAERARLEEALDRAETIGPAMKDVSRGESGGLSRHLVRAIRLLALTGMRRGDVVIFAWEHMDWHRAVIVLPRGKTGAREVPLTPQALSYLRTEYERAKAGLDVGEPRGFVCCTRSGTPVHPENIERAWQAVRKAAKLDGSDGKPAVRLHDLRHSWASDAISAGVPLYVVGRVLGHRQPTTTARYAHLHDDAVRDGLALAGAAIEAAASTTEEATRLPSRKKGRHEG